MPFKLDPRLESDSSFIDDLDLCHIRLSNNAAFPWILLVPKRKNVVEIVDLSEQDQLLLLQEINKTSKMMQSLFRPSKLNIANLGNIVPQLHIHMIARYTHDKAWPGPVWNSGITDSYQISEQEQRIKAIKDALR